MKSVIEWQAGNPTEDGEYLTVRESKMSSFRYVGINYWEGATCGVGRWQLAAPDTCHVVAWCKIRDIQVQE